MDESTSNVGFEYFWYYTIFIIVFFIYCAYAGKINEITTLQKSFGQKVFFQLLFICLYFLFLLISMILITTKENICGSVNLNLAFRSTVFGFSLIFLVGIIMINTFDGWIRGFSNTFGLGLITLLGVKNLFMNPINSKEENRNIQKIYNDPYTLLNEMVTDNISYDASGTTFEWQSFKDLELYFNFPTDEKNNVRYTLLNFINLKDLVSYGIWYFLFGTIALLFSINTLLNDNTCSLASDESEFDDYLKKS